MKNHSDEDISTLPGEYEYLLTGHFYHVKIDRNLNVIEVKLNSQSPYFCDFWKLDLRAFEFFAKDEEEAVKIAKEKAIELIESGEWDNPKEEEE
jgi:hypothetical protein